MNKKCKVWELLRRAEFLNQRIIELTEFISNQAAAGEDITELAKELAEAYAEKRAFGRETVEIREGLPL